ncbi:MAG: hypothetical protein WBO12_17695, partial [Xanthobacteraceae bacterium]
PRAMAGILEVPEYAREGFNVQIFTGCGLSRSANACSSGSAAADTSALMILAQCRPDQQRLCAGVPAGGGKIFSCLGANAQQLSPICYDAPAQVSE